MDLEKFFNPTTVAVIGASNDPKKVGYALMKNLLAGKSNRSVYPVTLTDGEVQGKKAYHSILDIPESVDLALIAVRSDIASHIVEECGRKGIRHVIVISAGFKEIGRAGDAREAELRMAAEKHGIALLGPNCLGVIDAHADLNASFAAGKPRPGGIAFISQSGAMGTALLDIANREGIGISKFVSLGNEAMLTETEFLDVIARDDSTKGVLAYFEAVRDGAHFMERMRAVTEKKPLVLIKAGRSLRGLSAVASHTGSLTSADAVFMTAARQSGALIADSLGDLVACAKLFELGITKPLRRIAVLTNGGGPSIVAADFIDLSPSLELASFSDSVMDGLRGVLPDMAAVGNPVDAIGDAPASRFESALKILSGEKDIDAILAIVTPQMMTEMEATADVFANYHAKKPIVPVFLGGETTNKGVKRLHERGMVNFSDSQEAVRALEILASHEQKSVPAAKKESAGQSTKVLMPFPEMRGLLTKYGLEFDGEFVESADDLPPIFARLHHETAVMKVVSPDVIHKSDIHAVKTNIQTIQGALAAWKDITGAVLEAVPKARIDGMLIQPTRLGREIIIGMKRDRTFGPVIVLGIGGVLVELLKDTALRIAPVSRNDALHMMDELKLHAIFRGYRGEEPVAVEKLADIVANLSRLSLEHPEISEIDLNPVIANSKNAYLADVRMMVERADGGQKS